MLDREACERRVYRLATLLTGDPKAATRVITSVVGAQPDLRRLDSAHLDRLTVLRSREIPSRRLEADGLPDGLARALAGLSEQQREAWVFTHVYRMSPREFSRGMDCSRRAAQLHLDGAHAAMTRAGIEDQDEAGGRLLRHTMRLDVPEFYRARQTRRRRLRQAVIGVAVVLALAAAGVAGVYLFGGDGDEGADAADTGVPRQEAPGS